MLVEIMMVISIIGFNMKLNRTAIDNVLSAYCKEIGLIYSTMHDEAFCIQNRDNSWLYLWYDENGNCASEYIAKIEKLITDYKLKLSDN